MVKQFGNPDSCTITNVWLLNLIPYAGLGLFYGGGPQSLIWLLGFWIYELAAGVHLFTQYYLPLYFILSIVGSVALLHRQGKFNSMNSQSISTYRAEHHLSDDDDEQASGFSKLATAEQRIKDSDDDEEAIRQSINSPNSDADADADAEADTDADATATERKLQEVHSRIEALKIGALKIGRHADETSSEFALSSMEQKARKAERMLQKMRTDEESKFASESFEHKLSAAEKQMKARTEAEEEEDQQSNTTFGGARANVTSAGVAPNVVPQTSAAVQPNANTVFNSEDDARMIQLGIGVDAAATAGEAPAMTLNPYEDAGKIQTGVGADSAAASAISGPGASAWSPGSQAASSNLDFSPQPISGSSGASAASDFNPQSTGVSASSPAADPFPASTSASDPFGTTSTNNAMDDDDQSNPFAPDPTPADQGAESDPFATADKSDPFGVNAFGTAAAPADKSDPFGSDAFAAGAAPAKSDPFAADAFAAAPADQADVSADRVDPFPAHNKSSNDFATEAGLSDPFADDSKSKVAQVGATKPVSVAQPAAPPPAKEVTPSAVTPSAVSQALPDPVPTTDTPSTSADIFANPFGSFDPGFGAAPSTFELPSFNFSFDLPGTAAHATAAATPGEKVICPKCGKDKDVNFSFCLSCGHNYT